MATRHSKDRRTKRGSFTAALGAIALSFILFVAIYYAIDDFTMYWFILVNQDSTTDRRRKEDFTWYDGYTKRGPGTSNSNSNGSNNNTNVEWEEGKPGVNTPNNPNFIVTPGDPVAVMKQVEASLTLEERQDPMTFFRFLIYYMDSMGYVPNACIAVMANSEGEISSISGNKLGVWLYQGYSTRNGPDGKKSSTVQDNDGWYSWVEGYYNKGSGLGFFQWSDGRAMHLIEHANSEGVPWQSIWLQIVHLLEWENQKNIWNTLDSTAPGVDPQSSTDVTASEWLHRLFANEMSGGYERWDTYDMTTNHGHNERKRLDAIGPATDIYNQYSRKDPWFQSSFDVNDWHYPFGGPTYDNSTPQGLLIARMALLLASGDTTQDPNAQVDWTQHGYDSPDMDPNVHPELQYYREANMAVVNQSGVYWASCDASATTAILLAGVDTEWVHMSTSAQHSDMDNRGVPEGKWIHVGSLQRGKEAVQLQPGDVIVKNGHIKIWIGANVASERFEGTAAGMYQGSLKQYYPRVSGDTGMEKSLYDVYRCVDPDWSSDGWDKFMARLDELGGLFPELPRQYPFSK